VIAVIIGAGICYVALSGTADFGRERKLEQYEQHMKTASQTSDWRTYTDTQSGIKFQYPENFSVSNNNKGLIEINSNDKYNEWGLTIEPASTRSLPALIKIDDCIENDMGCPGIVSTDFIVNNGVHGRIDYIAGEGGINNTKAYILNNNKLYTFYSHTAMSGRIMGDIFKKMISTLKFTN
jgi:hypothetical protein